MSAINQRRRDLYPAQKCWRPYSTAVNYFQMILRNADKAHSQRATTDGYQLETPDIFYTENCHLLWINIPQICTAKTSADRAA